MNRCILIGRLCADPTIRQTQNGKQVASYRIAVDRPMSKSETDFFTIVASGNTASFVERFLKKGMRIAVEGHIQTRSYEDNDGKKVTVTEIIADRHEFCEGRQAGGNAGFVTPTAPAEPVKDTFETISEDGEDLPF